MDTPGLPVAQRTQKHDIKRPIIIGMMRMQETGGWAALAFGWPDEPAGAEGTSDGIARATPSQFFCPPRWRQRCGTRLSCARNAISVRVLPSIAIDPVFVRAHVQRRLAEKRGTLWAIAMPAVAHVLSLGATGFAPRVSPVARLRLLVKAGSLFALLALCAGFKLWVTHAWPSPAACVWRGVMAGSALLLPRILQEGWA